ncbi:MAG TPA: 2-oxoglutarate and iron-dependent oxygenase domain-containing protein, partial [Novosphingobium sp.]|nr:2-oxoglutarate and iron-dependent oxygenase domain-containing protein [Novosphingobium sp.]
MTQIPPQGSALLPLIDLAGLLDGSPDGAARVAEAIGHACRTTGFFYVVGHGIEPRLLEAVFALQRRFFALPLAAKAALAIEQAGNNRGYVGMESENLDPDAPHDVKEAFNIGRESTPGDAAAPTPWPDLPGFRAAMSQLYAALRQLS